MAKRLYVGRNGVFGLAGIMLTAATIAPSGWPRRLLIGGGGFLSVLVIGDAIVEAHAEQLKAFRVRLSGHWQALTRMRLRSPWYLMTPDVATVAKEDYKAQLDQHLDVMKYGSAVFRGGLPSLSPLEMEFYQRGAVELLPIASEAGKAMSAFLMGVLHEMWAFPEEDARYWLAHFLNTEFHTPLTATVERFEKQVKEGVDSREALAGFYYQYERSFRAIGRIEKSHFLNKDLGSIAEAKDFKKRHDQFIEAVKKQLELPQFTPLKHWLFAIKQDEYWRV